MSDDIKTLTKGEFIIRTRDLSNSSLTVTAAVTPGGSPSTESRTFFRVVGSSINQLVYSPISSIFNHPRFQGAAPDSEVLDDVDDPVPQEETSNTVELRDALPVTLVP